MRGVRVVEVAQFTFVPASGALLAEWGADVIKVEHAVNGDAQRGLTNIGPVSAVGSFAPIMEHPNHGKRSIGLALETEEGLAILHELVRRADVFSTNFLPEDQLPARGASPPAHRRRGPPRGQPADHLRAGLGARQPGP
jgi:crotonobetainyl-CoA:carnitine CoA-transferase CaiB-like acyl-CoA transferase